MKKTINDVKAKRFGSNVALQVPTKQRKKSKLI